MDTFPLGRCEGILKGDYDCKHICGIYLIVRIGKTEPYLKMVVSMFCSSQVGEVLLILKQGKVLVYDTVSCVKLGLSMCG